MTKQSNTRLLHSVRNDSKATVSWLNSVVLEFGGEAHGGKQAAQVNVRNIIIVAFFVVHNRRRLWYQAEHVSRSDREEENIPENRVCEFQKGLRTEITGPGVNSEYLAERGCVRPAGIFNHCYVILSRPRPPPIEKYPFATGIL